ncbi:DUF6480 family protein [Streptomyces sp. JJ36]|uniref:DUF6480 family protein n=1 Tax=Streptomyces sp. JJ36 TaxID=2736645 RepID=UPI001F20FB44|nr:DUF6480 family protein [Streptomyces sp. JJ36]MCF6522346.1 hypothetical protein [Streptomyces sp. JJ36]
MTHSDGSESADPDPSDTPGLTPGSQFRQGDTPPAEGSTLETGPQEKYNPVRGWSAGPLIVLAVFSLLIAGFFVGRLIHMW